MGLEFILYKCNKVNVFWLLKIYIKFVVVSGLEKGCICFFKECIIRFVNWKECLLRWLLNILLRMLKSWEYVRVYGVYFKVCWNVKLNFSDNEWFFDILCKNYLDILIN